MKCNSPYQGGRKKRQDHVSCMVQLQAESARQSNTGKYCLLVLNTWQNKNQGLLDTGHAGPLASGMKKQEYSVFTTADDLAQKIWFSIDIATRLYISASTWPVLGPSTSSKYLHYHQMIVYVDWRSLEECFERTLSPLEIALICRKWVRHSTHHSGARTPDSSSLLPSHFCMPLKETGREWGRRTKVR